LKSSSNGKVVVAPFASLFLYNPLNFTCINAA
jgi:hypothetical protein